MEHILFLILLVTITALIVNLPFGYLRSGTKKFSLKWFLYIHLPVPFIFILRNLFGLGYRVIPIVIAGAVIGQYAGGLIRELRIS